MTYIMAENREEVESRDFTTASKSSQAILTHSGYSCIGSATCFRQKPVKRFFPQALAFCAQLQKVNDEVVPVGSALFGSGKNQTEVSAVLHSSRNSTILGSKQLLVMNQSIASNKPLLASLDQSVAGMESTASPVKALHIRRKTG